MKRLLGLIALLRYINEHPLAGRHRLMAYSRFARWQITQWINPGEKIISFVGPTCLSVIKGMTGATGNIYLGLHDFCEMGFLLHFLRRDDLFADIGANVGSYSVLASGVSKAKTIAFEPSVKTFSHLQKNISLNKIHDKVTAYNLALGSKIDKLSFTTALDTVNHVIPQYDSEKNKDKVEVDVDTLDNILQEQQVPAMIKIDVEGFETEVISGMTETLEDDNLKAIIIELNGSGLRYGYDENNIHRKLLSKGFASYSYNPFKRTFSLSAGYNAFNTLYLRDLDFVRARVAKADRIEVFKESF